MTTKQPIQRLPFLLITGVLSAGLLLGGCSNNDSADVNTANHTETTTDNEEIAAAADTSDTSDETMTEQEGTVGSTSETALVSDDAENETMIDNDNINPVTASTTQKSLVTNPTQAGTPEDTVKKALNSLYYGEVKDAVSYYQVDMANFEEELANTQSAFQQTVEGVTITDTQYNGDKTRATITGELMLKGQSEPAPLTYQLQKIEGQWKILG